MQSASQRIPIPFTSQPTAGPVYSSCVANKPATATFSKVDMSSSFFPTAQLFPVLGDWFKLALIGAIVEFARRTISLAWATFIEYFFITARFEDDSPSYDWLMVWLSKCNAW